MTELSKKLKFIQRGRATVRFHGMPMRDYQRVDAHSYGVAMLTTLLTPTAPPARRAQLLQAALEHDLAEHISGDIPAPTKRTLDIRDLVGKHEERLMAAVGLGAELMLSPEDRRVLKLADAAEGCLHCIEERRMGNQNMGERAFYAFWTYCTVEQGIGTLARHGAETDDYFAEVALKIHIQDEWRSVNGGSW